MVAQPSRASRMASATMGAIKATPQRLTKAEQAVAKVPKVTTWAEVGILWGLYVVTVAIPPSIATANYVSYQWGQITSSPAARWLGLAGDGQPQGRRGRDGNAAGEAVATAAKGWAGRDYKPGVQAMCASWVRSVLAEVGIEVGVAQGSAGPLMADSFHGADLGTMIYDANDLRPGDIVMFADTYNGPGRSPIPGKGRITHVGIYVGNGEMVDRSTMSAPVRQRPISTFKFHSALRPSAYADTGADSADGAFPIAAYIQAISSQESGHSYSAVNPHSGAMGRYQFMPATMASVAGACPAVATVPSQSEFLSSPELQDAVMRCKVERDLQTIQAKSDDINTQCRMMASTHYSGNPDRWNHTGRQTYNGANYPSIAAYTTAVCRGIE